MNGFNNTFTTGVAGHPSKLLLQCTMPILGRKTFMSSCFFVQCVIFMFQYKTNSYQWFVGMSGRILRCEDGKNIALRQMPASDNAGRAVSLGEA
jgi:hypothetical protein